MNSQKRLMGIAFSVALLSLSVPLRAPVHALDNAPPQTQTDIDKLKEDGYTCKYLYPGWQECTKPGETKQWCDSTGTCEEVARELPPSFPGTVISPVQTAPVNGEIFWTD